MDERKELQQIIYDILKTQIEFGTYRCGDHLPKMEMLSQYLLVSVDTVRMAYHQLKKEGYIKISKNAGTIVKKHYDKIEIEAHIQDYFSARKDMMMDIVGSLLPLISHMQWYAMKNASSEVLDALEQLSIHDDETAANTYIIVYHLQLIYSTLENELLVQLVWQIFVTFYVPFYSIPDNLKAVRIEASPLLFLIDCCRNKDWDTLRVETDKMQKQILASFRHFYHTTITTHPSQNQKNFSWSSYKKASQLCYTISLDILTAISRGIYPDGSFLPSLEKFAEEKQVSVSTIRRSLSLLSNIGAVRSINGKGTKILPFDENAKYCDFTNPNVKKHLLILAQGLQIVTLSCREVLKDTLISLDDVSIQEWMQRISEIRNVGHYELISFAVLELIARHTPSQTIRIVYSELLKQFFWGNPLRSIRGQTDKIHAYYSPFIDRSLEYLRKKNTELFSQSFEALMIHDLDFVIDRLASFGISESKVLTVHD